MIYANYLVSLTEYQKGSAAATVLVNTVAGRVMHDRLQTAEDLSTLLDEVGVDRSAATVSAADVDAARALRAELRTVLAADDRAMVVAHLNGLINAVAPDIGLSQVDEAGEWQWHLTVPAHIDAVSKLQLLTATSLLTMTQTFGLARFRGCTTTDCTGMFIDSSRGGRRRFCDPTRCGNRAHVAAYRARGSQGRSERDGAAHH